MPPNHYSVLGLAPSAAQSPSFQAALRRAYKVALLSAHPDKRKRGPPSPSPSGTTNGDDDKERGKADAYTVDDVKEALAVLSDPARRAEFDRWLRVSGGGGGGGGGGGQVDGKGRGGGEDFVLGLESLDLSDFEAGMPFVRMRDDSNHLSPDEDEGEDEGKAEGEQLDRGKEKEGEGGGGEGDEEEEEEEGARGEEEQMTWTRACRCGDQQGFRILERELEEAEKRGEREVLVGCEGCSLWVRVGFDVEEG